jgi:hypothetical protein
MSRVLVVSTDKAVRLPVVWVESGDVVAREQDRLDRYREPIPVSWTGVMTISNRYLNAVIVRDCDEVTHEAMWGEPKLRQLWGVDPRGWFQ